MHVPPKAVRQYIDLERKIEPALAAAANARTTLFGISLMRQRLFPRDAEIVDRDQVPPDCRVRRAFFGSQGVPEKELLQVEWLNTSWKLKNGNMTFW